MKINVKNLIQVLDVNARCLRAKVLIPDHENILFDIKDDTCYLTTCDNTMQIKSYLKVENEGEHCVQTEGKAFMNTIKLLDTEHVDVKINDKTMVLTSGKSKYRLPITPGNLYPKLKPMNLKESSLPASICQHISNASPFINEHDQRIQISGVSIKQEGDKLSINGTDSHCFYHADISCDEEMEPVIIHKSITSVIDVFKNSRDIVYGASKEMAVLKDNAVEVTVRTLEGVYPKMAHILAQKDEGGSVVLNVAHTAKSIRRALVYSSVKVNEVVLHFQDGEVYAEAEDKMTGKKAKEYLEASEIKFEDFKVAINGNLFIRAINGVESENVKIRMKDNKSPIFVTDEFGEKDAITIFMPIVLKDQ